MEKTKLRKILSPVVGAMPFFMLVVTMGSAVVSSTGFYHKSFYALPDSVGYSIATGIVFLYHYSFNKYCTATRVAVVALILMNVLSLATKKTDYYNTMHDIYIGGFVIVVAVILRFKK